MFFFLTVFMQAVWGYSALKTGLAYLPFTAALFIGAGAVAQLVPRIGARPLLITGSAAAAAGLDWLSRLSAHHTYTRGLLGPTMCIAAGRWHAAARDRAVHRRRHARPRATAARRADIAAGTAHSGAKPVTARKVTSRASPSRRALQGITSFPSFNSPPFRHPPRTSPS